MQSRSLNVSQEGGDEAEGWLDRPLLVEEAYEGPSLSSPPASVAAVTPSTSVLVWEVDAIG